MAKTHRSSLGSSNGESCCSLVKVPKFMTWNGSLIKFVCSSICSG
ncbi:hypothetical protein APHNP_0467 [Anaplasma phagocytophilum str. ApNP]|uniref:Uncharacterized protein n=2 Tax=Anaplasma phagocytophilum TaxID=948 RepID=A0A0F3NGJ0_ANAPH|nr:hypothetical protein APHMUC_0665 [Anaplasma phagocytophilum str. ApMUC09]KJV66822.1 hypothetical protein APHNP_0467 [Anaplasma phagocytophilum str. ApNP]